MVDDHSHCNQCIRRSCHEGCSMTSCNQFCGAVFHGCKQDDHFLLCPYVKVPCINRENGCPHIMPRWRCGAHLLTCPASVVCCTNEWNRRPADREQQDVLTKLLKNGDAASEQLDTALMLRDQHFLNAALEQSKHSEETSVLSLTVPPSSTQLVKHSHATSLSNHFSPAVPPGLQSSICSELFGRTFEEQPEMCSRQGNDCTRGAEDDWGSGVNNCDQVENDIAIVNQSFISDVCDMRASPDDNQGLLPPQYSHTDSNECKQFPVLCLDLTIDSLTRCQPKQESIFTFMCAQVFRRDHYASHVKNVHSEIYAGLSGWLVQRCPLAYHGCPFSIRRMHPNSENTRVVYSTEVQSFGIQPSVSQVLYQRENSKNTSLFTELPTEVLEHIAQFLDGFSLNNLALTCRLLRDICYNVLPDKGVVIPDWQYKNANGRKHWYIARYVWMFTNSTTEVKTWGLNDGVFRMLHHIENCAFNTKVVHTDPYRLIPPLDIYMAVKTVK